MSLTLPAMAFVGVFGLIWTGLYFVGLGRRWGVLVPFGLMLLASSMSVPIDWYENVVPTIWLALQTKRASIFLAAGVATLVMVLVNITHMSGKRISLSSALLVVIGFYASVLRLHHDGAVGGIESMVFSVFTLLPMLFVVGITMDEPADFRGVLRCLAVVNVVFTFMCVMQFLINSKYLTMGNEQRFVGLTGNPQHAGVLVSFWITNSLWLLLNDRGRMLKPIYACLIGANIVMLIWTGSRTGMGMSAIGIAAVMYTRMGRTILFMPVVLIVAFGAMKIILSMTGQAVNVDRLTSMQDTRSGAWVILYQTGMSNPIFGAGTSETERSENSWLYAFATYGIGMLGLTVLTTIVAFGEFVRGVRLRKWLSMDDRRVLDLCLGAMAMFFAGAMLEGYMISRVSPSICFFMVFSVATGLIVRTATANRLANETSDSYYDDAMDLDEPAMAY